MRFVAVLVLLFAVLMPISAQTTKEYFVTVQVPGQGRTILRLSPLFTIDTANGILSVNVPASVREVVNVVLTRAVDGSYAVPAGATNVKVFVNGLRYPPGINYTLAGDKITPNSAAGNWPASAEVMIDYTPASN